MSDELHIVHAADIHLDSPLRGLDRLGNRDLAEDLRRATSVAFAKLISWTMNNNVDALVLAGDIYDGDLRDYTTGRFFAEQLAKLKDVDIPVFIVSGNHDAASVITKGLRLPDNVTQLPTNAVESIVLDDLGLAVHGQGFATKAITKNLAVDYPPGLTGMVNVGLLHTSVAGYEGHDSYAPCSVSDLTSRGYEYFALGHVHQRDVLSDGEHTVAFSGNLQGRHVKESGAKGFYSVRVSPGEPARLEFVECDVARWDDTYIDVGDADDWDMVLDTVRDVLGSLSREAGGRPLVLRVTLTGQTLAAASLVDTVKLTHELALMSERLSVTLAGVRNRTQLPRARQVLPPDEVERIRELADRQLLRGPQAKELAALEAEARTALLRIDPDLDADRDEDELVQEALQGLLTRMGGIQS